MFQSRGREINSESNNAIVPNLFRGARKRCGTWLAFGEYDQIGQLREHYISAGIICDNMSTFELSTRIIRAL